MSHALAPLTSEILSGLDDGALSEPVAPDFVKVSLMKPTCMMRMVTDLLSLSRIDNETSQLDIELTNFTAYQFLYFELLWYIKSQSEDTKKYELIRKYLDYLI